MLVDHASRHHRSAPQSRKIAVLVPSRGRPRECFRMVNTALNMAAGCLDDVRILVGLDEDDPKRAGYRVYHGDLGRRRGLVELHEFPAGTTVSENWNRLARLSGGMTEILLMGNDDVVFETRGWDRAFADVHDAESDGIYVAWGDDRINGEAHCAFPAVSAKWVRHLGYFAPECGFAFGYNDSWIFDLGRRVGRLRYLPGVVIRHDHHSVGGVRDDTTLRNRGTTGKWEHDRRLFVETAAARERDALRLRGAMRVAVP